MIAFSELHVEQDFRRLPEPFFQTIEPTGLAQPSLVIASPSCANLLGVDIESLTSDESLAILSGNARFAKPSLAMKYTGHQFGYYNPDLGDGRGLLLGDVLLDDEQSPHHRQRYDLHLKGAGLTPFSRQGDGRAVLRSSIREFLASETLTALGMPSSRALAVINSATPVQRETRETGATLLRVTPCHIRFGHFEFAWHSGDTQLITKLADFCVERYFPCFLGDAQRYAELFKVIAKRTASMIAKWQAFGFAHGVMNTDNMSILGETFDFGPYGFLDAFNPSHICNHSDHAGRYAFDQQPAIAHWNLSVLAHAFRPLVEESDLANGMQSFNETFNAEYLALMRHKTGLSEIHEGDQGLIFRLLNLMAKEGLDYSYFFRKLANIEQAETYEHLRDMCVDRAAFEKLISDLNTRWSQEDIEQRARMQHMNQINPKYVLRNHLAQTAIKLAQKGEYEEVRKLHEILGRPFDEQPENENYAELPPDWANQLEISCSS